MNNYIYLFLLPLLIFGSDPTFGIELENKTNYTAAIGIRAADPPHSIDHDVDLAANNSTTVDIRAALEEVVEDLPLNGIIDFRLGAMINASRVECQQKYITEDTNVKKLNSIKASFSDTTCVLSFN